MKSFVGSGAGSEIYKIFNARNSICVCSPWIGPEMYESLVEKARKGIGVWVITGDDRFNVEHGITDSLH